MPLPEQGRQELWGVAMALLRGSAPTPWRLTRLAVAGLFHQQPGAAPRGGAASQHLSLRDMLRGVATPSNAGAAAAHTPPQAEVGPQAAQQPPTLAPDAATAEIQRLRQMLPGVVAAAAGGADAGAGMDEDMQLAMELQQRELRGAARAPAGKRQRRGTLDAFLVPRKQL